MIAGLLGWFAGEGANKRRYPRRKKPYRVWLTIDGTSRAAIGIDISAGGLGLLTERRIGRREFDVLLRLDGNEVPARAKVMRERPSLHHGTRAFSYGLQFIGIKADDWDAVVRFTTDEVVAEPDSFARQEIELIRMQPDDTARLLPLSLQNRLLAMIVKRKQLAPLDPKTTPLVQYFYGGIVRYEKNLMHRLTIQSKLVAPDGNSQLFETHFLFDDQGGNIGILTGGPLVPTEGPKRSLPVK
jgi:hypothetical protein